MNRQGVSRTKTELREDAGSGLELCLLIPHDRLVPVADRPFALDREPVECSCGARVERDRMGRKWEADGTRHGCRVTVGPLRVINCGGR